MLALPFHKPWSTETKRLMTILPKNGIFLTGIEGSDPYIDGVRRNQLQEAHDFYTNYAQRLANIRNLGIAWLRFGPPYSQVHTAPDTYNFDFIDKVVAKCQELNITLMADLLHFGLPDWLHERNSNMPYFQNPDFPEHFARYAETFARRYPHIRFYTIINEPFVTAYMSSKLGMWNEQLWSEWRDDFHFVQAASNIARAAILARQAIEKVSKDVIFVQNESFEVARAVPGSDREAEADRFNLRRFAPLDLIFGRPSEEMKNYLLQYGLSEETYNWFMANGRSDKTVLGIDHYTTCVHHLHKDRVVDGDRTAPMELYEIARDYWQRYPLPLLHTEVNAWPDQAVRRCQETYDIMARLKRHGYPVLGMGWYGDELQVGWHVGMRGPDSYQENPVGLFYKGQPQPVAVLFSQLARKGFPSTLIPWPRRQVSAPSYTETVGGQ